MATTPVYFWPYQSLTDPPNGAVLGQNLALAVEATVQANAATAAAATAASIARMGCGLRRVANQALPDAATTTVSWDTEDEDTNGLWSAGTTVTIPSGGGGIWAITFGIIVIGSVATARSLVAIVPSAGAWAGGSSPLRNSFGAAEDTCAVAGTIPMSAGDTFTCTAFVDMAGAANMTATVSAYRVGR